MTPAGSDPSQPSYCPARSSSTFADQPDPFITQVSIGEPDSSPRACLLAELAGTHQQGIVGGWSVPALCAGFPVSRPQGLWFP